MCVVVTIISLYLICPTLFSTPVFVLTAFWTQRVSSNNRSSLIINHISTYISSTISFLVLGIGFCFRLHRRLSWLVRIRLISGNYENIPIHRLLKAVLVWMVLIAIWISQRLENSIIPRFNFFPHTLLLTTFKSKTISNKKAGLSSKIIQNHIFEVLSKNCVCAHCSNFILKINLIIISVDIYSYIVRASMAWFLIAHLLCQRLRVRSQVKRKILYARSSLGWNGRLVKNILCHKTLTYG